MAKIKVESEDNKPKKDLTNKSDNQSPDKNIKRKPWMYVVIGLVVLGAAAMLGFIFFGGDGVSITSNTAKQPMAARLIDGVIVDTDEANAYPLAIMIENLITVRPQAGLDQANVVYEALAEGGITRFMAVFVLSEEIARIGPVRSARPYYLDWAQEYGALYGHVGGSPTSLARINRENIFDLNQFFNSQYYYRESSIVAPHNVFTDSEKLTFALRDKEAPAEGSYDGWPFTDAPAVSALPANQTPIVIDYSTFNYKVEYSYNPGTNSYDRVQAGEPFMSSGNLISPTNVIVQYVVTGLEDASRLKMTTIGEGDSVVFRNGEAVEATWKKDSIQARTRYFDRLTGAEVVLTRGSTWVQVVPTTALVEYQ